MGISMVGSSLGVWGQVGEHRISACADSHKRRDEEVELFFGKTDICLLFLVAVSGTTESYSHVDSSCNTSASSMTVHWVLFAVYCRHLSIKIAMNDRCAHLPASSVVSHAVSRS